MARDFKISVVGGRSTMTFFASPILWSGPVRYVLFWMIVIAVWGGLAAMAPWIDQDLILQPIHRALAGDLAGLSTQGFAFSLAGSLGAFAASLAAAFTLMHTVMIRVAIGGARRRVNQTKDMGAFAAAYETIHKQFEGHALLAHAWK